MIGAREKLYRVFLPWLVVVCGSLCGQVDSDVERALRAPGVEVESIELLESIVPGGDLSSALPTEAVAVVVVLGSRDRPIASTTAECAALQEQALSSLDLAPGTVRYQYRFSPVLLLALSSRRPLTVLEEVGLLRSAHLDVEGAGALEESRVLVRADPVFEAGFTGAGTVVAVLDSGVDRTHTDLADTVIHEYRFLQGGADVGLGAQDDHGHGTNVTGIVAGRGVVAPRGLAPGVEVVAIKVLNSNNTGAFSDWAAGVEYVVNLHDEDNDIDVDVINMSLVSNSVYSTACDDVLPSFSAACEAARQRGIAIFASSGNIRRRDGISLPSCFSSVVAVGATSDTLPGLLSEFTNRNELVELVAPGDSITATGLGGGESTFSGTSQASPHCAALACLLRGIDPELTPDGLLEIISQTGVPTYDSSTHLTFPRIDVERAVSVLLPGEDCNSNDVNDVRDIFIDGTSLDCNANDVPDDCDIARGDAADCNLNGVPDGCEVSANVEFSQIFRQGVGGLPLGVIAVDLDADQAVDIAVVDGEEGFVGILYNDRDGGFTLPVSYFAAAQPTDLAAADLDGDRRPDLVLTDRAAPGVVVLRNVGDRFFDPPQTTTLDFDPVALDIGDIDGDGWRDVATVGGRDGQVALLFNDGEGAFLSPPRTLFAGQRPSDVLLTDVNQDGRLDLVVGSHIPPAMFLFTQDSSGQFASGIQLLTNGSIHTLATLDVNEDTLPDLTVSFVDRSQISVFVNGHGWFLPPEVYRLVSPGNDLLTVDVNGDQRKDVVAVTAESKGLSVLLGRPNGLHEPALTVPMPLTPTRLATGDFDGDTVPDLVVAHGYLGEVTVHLNRTEGLLPEDRNRDGVLDECEHRLSRGDCDGAGDGMTVTDAVVLVNFNFLGRAMPPCLAACDVDGDGVVRGVLTDAIYHLSFLFRGGPPPVSPFPGCVPLRPIDWELGCEELPPECATP